MLSSLARFLQCGVSRTPTPATMPTSPLDPDLDVNTHIFRNLIIDEALASDSPMAALQKYKVKTVTVLKTEDVSRHEYLSVRVDDPDSTTGSDSFVFFERMRSDRQDHAAIAAFRSHPKSVELMAALETASLPSVSPSEIPLLHLSSLSHPGSSSLTPSSSTLSTPLTSTPSTPLTSTPSTPLTSRPSTPLTSTSSVPLITPTLAQITPTPALSIPNPSLGDKIMGSSTRAAQKAMAKKGGQYLARDQVVGGGQIVTLGYGKARIVRELKPEGLTLYDVAVIADVVHKTAPLYSLLENQCYWFACIICDAIIRHRPTQDNFPGRLTMTNILVPNLSAEAGRWMGILVSKVEPVVLDTVMTEFTIAAELHNSKVKEEAQRKMTQAADYQRLKDELSQKNLKDQEDYLRLNRELQESVSRVRVLEELVARKFSSS